MDVADKAVDTEEIDYPLIHNTCLEVARLEAVLNGLVEQKVEAIKNEKCLSTNSSPKSLIQRFRIGSSSTASSKDKDSGQHSLCSNNRKHRRRKRLDAHRNRSDESTRRAGHCRHKFANSSPESARYSLGKNCEHTPALSEEDTTFIHSDHGSSSCCCGEDIMEVRINPIPKYEDEYVSLKIDDEDEEEEEARRKRARRKRRRRRRKRRRLKEMTAAVMDEVKVIDPDELPPRARWTIVATACILLFMCLMLVGVTLRMAPLIDDMVRRENEELDALLRDNDIPQNKSPAVTEAL